MFTTGFGFYSPRYKKEFSNVSLLDVTDLKVGRTLD